MREHKVIKGFRLYVQVHCYEMQNVANGQTVFEVIQSNLPVVIADVAAAKSAASLHFAVSDFAHSRTPAVNATSCSC